MSTLRDAAQKALQALEDHAKQYPHMQKGYTMDAIAALRTALAEHPEQEPTRNGTSPTPSSPHTSARTASENSHDR